MKKIILFSLIFFSLFLLNNKVFADITGTIDQFNGQLNVDSTLNAITQTNFQSNNGGGGFEFSEISTITGMRWHVNNPNNYSITISSEFDGADSGVYCDPHDDLPANFDGYVDFTCNAIFSAGGSSKIPIISSTSQFYIYGNSADIGLDWHVRYAMQYGFTINEAYLQLNYISTPPDTTTRIRDILPINNDTTASTSVIVSANYYLADPDPNNYQTPPLAIVEHLHRTDQIGTPDQTFELDSPVYNALTPISHTFTLPTNTTWELRFDLSGDGYYFISPLGYPTVFNVVTDPSIGSSGYTTCSITDLAGCFQNAIVFLFYPSSASLSQFGNLYTEFIQKPPFGYVVAIQTALKQINDTNTSVFTLQSMPILNTYVFDPIRLALTWVLWVAFAFVLFHRLKNISL